VTRRKQRFSSNLKALFLCFVLDLLLRHTEGFHPCSRW